MARNVTSMSRADVHADVDVDRLVSTTQYESTTEIHHANCIFNHCYPHRLLIFSILFIIVILNQCYGHYMAFFFSYMRQ